MADRWVDMGKFKIPTPKIQERDAGRKIDDTRGLFVLHAVLLRTGKVLMFCGHVENRDYPGLSYVWDPDNTDEEMDPIQFPTGVDLFCCHYAQLEDGKVLVVGGSIDFHAHVNNPDRPDGGSYGKKAISIFDPDTEEWTLSKDGVPNEMDQGRWYPTAVALGDGSVAVFSGRRENSGLATGSIAEKVEIISGKDFNYKARVVNYDKKIVRGTDVTTNLDHPNFALPIYPGMVLNKDGKIFFVGTTWGQEIPNPSTRSITIDNSDIENPKGVWEIYADPVDPSKEMEPSTNRREEGTFVLLPLLLPDYEGKILVLGGSQRLNDDGDGLLINGGDFNRIADPNDPYLAEILDTSVEPPEWSLAGKNELNVTGRTNGARINGHCVILPDATVLILGGSDGYRWKGSIVDNIPPDVFTSSGVPLRTVRTTPLTTATEECEIFDGTDFKKVASLCHARRYHCAALLLKDGRVLVAGGADPDDIEEELIYPSAWNAPTPGRFPVLNRKDYEIYEPDYYSNNGRPTINRVELAGVKVSGVKYGSTFIVFTPEGNDISKAALIRLGAPTHHTDTEQRYIELKIKSNALDNVELEVTSNKNLAPPGFYMLWILKGNLPCKKASIIRISDKIIPADEGCFIATAATTSSSSWQVTYLRKLRAQIAQNSNIGATFISTINSIYYSFSPNVAKLISNYRLSQNITLHLVVNPTVKIIQKTDSLLNTFFDKRTYSILLILALCCESIFALVFLPVIVLICVFSLLNKIFQLK